MISDFAVRRLRSPQDLADAREALERAGWQQCEPCGRYFKPDALVPDKACHLEICTECREQQEIDAVSVED